MLDFLLFALFCWGIYELFKAKKTGLAIFLIVAFLIWAIVSLG
jgi:hypothetical protein